MSGEVKILKNSANAANNEIDALSGATISSNAVAEAVNEALANFEKITGKAGAN
jgi:Na+-translocating ferredoxin:NAD+ oxidoreductase RnfG subunit